MARFHFITSTGRTATTYLAALLDGLPGVAATHEGYRGGRHSDQPILPLINLENNLAYQRPADAAGIVAEKRCRTVFQKAARETGASTLIDVAYFYAPMAEALLTSDRDIRMVAILRDAESFVRSATQLHGEDPLPVGWPSRAKPLSDRERFIAMGRLRPQRTSPEHRSWPDWSAVRRNIWLWQETNTLLLRAKRAFDDRVTVLPFEDLQKDRRQFVSEIAAALRIDCTSLDETKVKDAFHNRKPSGYQLGPSPEWTEEEQAALTVARKTIADLWRGDGRH